MGSFILQYSYWTKKLPIKGKFPLQTKENCTRDVFSELEGESNLETFPKISNILFFFMHNSTASFSGLFIPYFFVLLPVSLLFSSSCYLSRLLPSQSYLHLNAVLVLLPIYLFLSQYFTILSLPISIYILPISLAPFYLSAYLPL